MIVLVVFNFVALYLDINICIGNLLQLLSLNGFSFNSWYWKKFATWTEKMQKCCIRSKKVEVEQIVLYLRRT